MRVLFWLFSGNFGNAVSFLGALRLTGRSRATNKGHTNGISLVYRISLVLLRITDVDSAKDGISNMNERRL